MRVAPRTKIVFGSSRICFITFPDVFLFYTSVHRGKRNYLFYTVRLYLGIVRGAVSVYFTALCAFIHYDIPFFRVGHSGYRLHRAATLVCSVPRIYVNVYRPKAKGTVVARAFTERFYLFAAVQTDKSAVIFRKSFYFHSFHSETLRFLL